MFAIGISLVKNEEDIIESFIRYNLNFLDGIVVFDNQSTDGTRDILKALMQEGLSICLSDDHEGGYWQSQKMTNLLRRVGSVFPVEFIVPIDADEFIECKNRNEFHAILNTIPINGAGLWKWKTYVLTPELIRYQKKATKPDDFRFCRNEELPQFHKVVIRASKKYINEMTLTQGNHELITPHVFQLIELEIPLAHYPVRNKMQIYKKAIFGSLGYIIKEKVEKKKSGDQGFQWKNLYNRILQGEDFSETELCNLSLNYAQVPGDHQWPENVQEANINRYKVENQYNRAIRGYNPLVEVIKSYQDYILGSVNLFDVEDTYKAENPNTSDVSKNMNNTELESPYIGVFRRFTNFGEGIEKPFLDIPPHKYLYDKFSLKSVFDIGCGLAQYLRLYYNLGVRRVIGADAIRPDSIFIHPRDYILHDLTTPIDLHEQFDLVICCEGAEHLYPGTEETLLDNIERHAENLILFTAAVPGQLGQGICTAGPFLFWANKWADRKWAPKLFETFGFRTLSTFTEFRRNTVLLSRATNTSEAMEKWASLIRISEEEFIYQGQQPDIITNPLTCDFPS